MEESVIVPASVTFDPLISAVDRQDHPGDDPFAADDHRNYNRHGEAFDVGETFAGVEPRGPGSR